MFSDQAATSGANLLKPAAIHKLTSSFLIDLWQQPRWHRCESNVFSRMMSDETKLDDMSLEAPLESFGIQSNYSKLTKRSRNYTQKRISSWCESRENISSDHITNNDQPSKAQWKRNHANNKKIMSDRSVNSLDHSCAPLIGSVRSFMQFLRRLSVAILATFQENSLQCGYGETLW